MVQISNINIKLDYNKGFKWHNKDGHYWAIGYFYDDNHRCVSGKGFLDHITKLYENNNLVNGIKELNGIFSVVVKAKDELVIASDKTRFFPLFYSNTYDGLYISDDFYYLAGKPENNKINAAASIQYLSGAFTCSKETLIDNIFQLRPGELIHIKDDKTYTDNISNFSKRQDELLNYDKPELVEKCFEQFEKTGKKLVESIGHKQVLLPLSGGYDSRLIACWLKKYGVQNVLCFTYGVKGTPDIKISEKVAKQLGFKWQYIEYNNQLIEGYFEDNIFQRYYRYLSRGTSMFYMQEYFAVKYLKENKLLDENFIAIPGHSGDVTGGSQLNKIVPPKGEITTADITLLKNIFKEYPLSNKEKQVIRNSIDDELHRIRKQSNSDLDYSILEDWLMKEKLVKYVLNSAHVFTFFGGQVRLPFWDNDLYEFWRLIPLEYRLNKTLYDEVLRKKYFQPLGVDFGSSLQPTSTDLKIYRCKDYLRKHLPFYIKNKLRKNNDWIFYDEITEVLLKNLKAKNVVVRDNGSFYLYRILQWYLNEIQEKYITPNK